VNNDEGSALKRAMTATPECLAIDRLAGTLTDRDRQHVEGCARCQTELTLLREFEEGRPTEDEGTAVRWIVAVLARRDRGMTRESHARPFGWFTPALRPWTMALAGVVLVTAVGYLRWDREPSVRQTVPMQDTYRTGNVQIVGPIGDVAAVPDALEWAPADGAVSYDVEVFEVDRTPLWRSTSSVPRVELPRSIVRLLVPGKTVLWEVRARNAVMAVIAESGTQRFRVAVSGSLPKE
jgi:hypothetical protein